MGKSGQKLHCSYQSTSVKLAIISHTEHYRRNGEIVGWGATVREINELTAHFAEVWHVAPLHEEDAPDSAIAYCSESIRFVPIPVTGGPLLKDKLRVLFKAPSILSKVWEVLGEVDVFQFRAPTGIGVYLLPFLTLGTSKRGWFKYAGNWQEVTAIGYAFQKWWLTSCTRQKVTINGRWSGLPAHILSFENPCLDTEERRIGQEVIQKKRYQLPLTACFIGRLDDAKGVSRIIDGLQELGPEQIKTMHFVGDGKKRPFYEERCQSLPIDCIFHGFMSRDRVSSVLAASQILLLPSASEGLPKVIAEGWNYGCIPIVSNVSAIPHYVNEENGHLWDVHGTESYADRLRRIDWASEEAWRQKALRGYKTAAYFTFQYYCERIFSEILT